MSEQETITSAREQLLDAALDLFAEHGFDGTSVRMLAEKADTNVAMVSYYFGSKEKLLEAVLTEKTAHVREQLDQLTNDKSHNAWAKFEVVIDTFVERIMLSGGKFHKLMMREISLGARPAIVKIVEEKISYNRNAIRSLVNEGIEQKIFREDIDFAMLLGTMFGTITQVTMSGGVFSKWCAIEAGGRNPSYEETRDRAKTHLKTLFARYMLLDPKKFNY